MTTMQRIRNESGLSLVKLAALAGVGANTIHKWERGKAKPHRTTAQLVADALNVPLYEYLGEPVPLKPCPFCDGEVTLAIEGNRRGPQRWFVTRAIENESRCNCRVFMESDLFMEDDKEAEKAAKVNLIEAWNRRARRISTKARWNHKKDSAWSGGGYTECTACGFGFADGMFHEVEEFKFCPHCGAKMEV